MAIKITDQQREVLKWVAEGKTVREICMIMGIATNTVQYHKGLLRIQADVVKDVQLVRWAIRQGLIKA